MLSYTFIKFFLGTTKICKRWTNATTVFPLKLNLLEFLVLIETQTPSQAHHKN